MRLLRSPNLSTREQEKIYRALKNYKQSSDEVKAAKENYVKVQSKDRNQLFSYFNQWLESFCRTEQNMIEVVKIFSPQIAKILQREIENYLRLTKEKLDEKYWDNKRDTFSEKELNEFTKKVLDIAMGRSRFHSEQVSTAYVVASDTLSHVGIKIFGRNNAETQDLASIIKSHNEIFEKRLPKILGDYDYASSQLLEEYAKKFYREQGYEIIESTPIIDKERKIDFIATKENEVIAVQVKKGQVSNQEVCKISECASTLIDKDYASIQKKVITIIAKDFPKGFLEIRDELKKRRNIDLQYLPVNEISKKLKRAGF